MGYSKREQDFLDLFHEYGRLVGLSERDSHACVRLAALHLLCAERVNIVYRVKGVFGPVSETETWEASQDKALEFARKALAMLSKDDPQQQTAETLLKRGAAMFAPFAKPTNFDTFSDGVIFHTVYAPHELAIIKGERTLQELELFIQELASGYVVPPLPSTSEGFSGAWIDGPELSGQPQPPATERAGKTGTTKGTGKTWATKGAGETWVPCEKCGRKILLSEPGKITKTLCSYCSPKGCFIATACCGSPNAPEVVALRTFRDQHLSASVLGRLIIAIYYRVGPGLAAIIGAHPRLRCTVKRFLIRPLAGLAAKKLRGE